MSSSEHADHDDQQLWTCSMHPQIQLPEPGKCPICGMDLIPLEKGKEHDLDPMTHVSLSERAKKLAEIRTVALRKADANVELRLLGRLSYDETKVHTVTSWTDGRIDRLLVSAKGEKIKKGQVIASLYSPEVYEAQVDLIQAKLQMDRLDKALPIARKAAEATLDSAKTRLNLLGVRPMSTKRITSRTRPPRNMAVTAKYGGTVVEQMVNEGAYVKAGEPIYRIADLDTIWAQLDAYEDDLAKVRVGQEVSLVISSFPDETFMGEVAFVDPIVDPRTRTAQIRVEIPNDKGRLSPGMFADAVLRAEVDPGEPRPLLIPESAPLFTGKRSVVYVEVMSAERPTYEVRVVQLGPKAGNVYPVMSGLEEGERVVTHGAFALDSDLQIKGGMSMMSYEDDAARAAREPVRTTKEFMKGLRPIVAAYLDVHEKLAADDDEGAAEAFSELARQSAGFDPLAPAEARKVYLELRDQVAAEARQAAKSKELDAMRRALSTLTKPLVVMLVRFGNPVKGPVRLVHCPMAFDGRGAFWLQRAHDIQNPYFGAAMFTCGEIQLTAQRGARMSPHAIHRLEPKRKAGAMKGHQH
jgi:Cu(I)/Ag(I) efflux system membrane fusion protein